MAPVHYCTGRFPPEDRLDWSELIPLLGPAAAAVARYDEALAAIPNPDALLSPLTTQEAVLSSEIEGIRATLGEILGFEAGRKVGSPELRNDIEEILNYRRAMRAAVRMLQDAPLSMWVVLEAHRMLLDGVRGRNKAPGEFRRIPNWIGPPGSSIENAAYVPIGADRLDGAMSRWERYMHEDAPDRLVQIAVLHAEFEALHPFLGGNGRLGRMLIPLFLWKRGLVRQPVFCISAYLEARRECYFAGLLSVSRDDDWTGWSRFFLEAVQTQAEENARTVRGIVDLYEDTKRRVATMTRSPYVVHALDSIFRRPVFGSTDFARTAGIPGRTARRILDVLCEGGVLELLDAGGGRRQRFFLFRPLLHLIEGINGSR